MAAIEDRARHPNSVAQPFILTARLAARSPSVSFYAALWNGSGYLLDPEFGGLAIYLSTPRTFASQVESVCLEVVDLVGGRYPEVHGL
jgi:hypothetical protein